MNGFSVSSTKETLNIAFDRNIFNDDFLSEILDIIEVNYLSKLVDFDESILNTANEIKSNIWQKEKMRLQKQGII